MKWVNEHSQKFLERGYLLAGETVDSRVRDIADHAGKLLGNPEFSDKFFDYMDRGWISLSSPVWANFGRERGLPISCFGSYVPDNTAGILQTVGEVGMMTKFGGGTSGYFGDVRHRGAPIKNNGLSSGSVHFMQLFDTNISVISQGSTRRGAFAAYLPVEHPDIMEFLEIGTEGSEIQLINTGVTVSDKWLEDMKAGDEEKRKVWAKLIQTRSEIGYPYILFSDNANKKRPEIYKDLNLEIKGSNLCSEIFLPENNKYSFVCCLSSVNLLKYDEWKDTDLVEVMVQFLDTVITDFINKLEDDMYSGDAERVLAAKFMERAYNFAKDHRAIGLGVLGWHSLLQSKMIPFESEEAGMLNVEVHKLIRDRAVAESKRLASIMGPAPIFTETNVEPMRNTTVMAIAPTTSSAFILGQVSQSIEPIWSNCYVKDLAKTKVTIKNPELKKLLGEKGKDTDEVWLSILEQDGSVQHLEFLSDEEKDVFKTFAEIDQYKVIEQAAVRQMFIDQGQSLNLLVMPSMETKEINRLMLYAWEKGIKSLYYQHSMSAAQETARKIANKKKKDDTTCVACEG